MPDRCREYHTVDFDGLSCALDADHPGMHVANAEDGPIVWERRDVVMEDEIVRVTQSNEVAMTAMEDIAPFVATMTGFKQQFIDAGWTPEIAERLVLEAWQAGRAANENG